jgi:hypothetical protein
MTKRIWTVALLFAGCATTQNQAPVNTSPRAAIDAIVTQSACFKKSWPEKGPAPAGYVKGMAHSFARVVCNYRNPKVTTLAGILGQSRGSSDKDVLSYGKYAKDASSGEGRIIIDYTVGTGLGMRESEGKYCESYDRTGKRDDDSLEAEAGTFQQSYNSMSACPRFGVAYEEFKANRALCDLDTWKEGVSANTKGCQDGVLGSGPGRTWQTFVKNCPAFGAEQAMGLLRNLRKHFGPINRQEAHYAPECEDMYRAISEIPGLCE